MKTLFRSVLFSLLLLFTSTVFAGSEDWEGTFTIQNPQGEQGTIIHHPGQMIILSMFYVTRSFVFGGRGSFNGFCPTEDGILKVDMKIDEFTKQVKKLGTLVNQQVVPGPTYS